MSPVRPYARSAGGGSSSCAARYKRVLKNPDGSGYAGARSRPEPDPAAMARALADFLAAAGLPEAAAGKAPERTAEAWADQLLDGYARDPVEVLRPTWPDRGGKLVSVTGIPFVSVCAHHLLPFFGMAHVAYLPGGQLTGLSRIEEMVRCLSRRLQLQERLGEEVAAALVEGTGARGAVCVLEAEHLCVFARGRRQRGPVTRTLAFAGELASDQTWQDRCLRWLAPALGARGAASAGAAGGPESSVSADFPACAEASASGD